MEQTTALLTSYVGGLTGTHGRVSRGNLIRASSERRFSALVEVDREEVLLELVALVEFELVEFELELVLLEDIEEEEEGVEDKEEEGDSSPMPPGFPFCRCPCCWPIGTVHSPAYHLSRLPSSQSRLAWRSTSIFTGFALALVFPPATARLHASWMLPASNP